MKTVLRLNLVLAIALGIIMQIACEPAPEPLPEEQAEIYPEPQQRHIERRDEPSRPEQPHPTPPVVAPDDDPNETEKENNNEVSRMLSGHIAHQPIEGGFYGIIDQSGNRYNPLNLPEEFKQDGLAVRFRVKHRPDVVTFRMWGKNVEIVEIEKK